MAEDREMMSTEEERVYDDEECDDVDEHAEEETGEEQQKFSSPEAGLARLQGLSPETLNAFQMLSEETIFNAFLAELVNRCDFCRKNLQDTDPTWMWTHMVFSLCMTFRHNYFGRRSENVESVPTVLVNYFENTEIPTILQTIVDLAQQTGYDARQYLKNMQEEDERSGQRHSTHYSEALTECRELQQRYRDYVELYRRCTGKWRPPRRQQNTMNQSRGQRMPYQPRQSHQRQQEQYQRRPNQYYQRQQDQRQPMRQQRTQQRTQYSPMQEQRNRYPRQEQRGYSERQNYSPMPNHNNDQNDQSDRRSYRPGTYQSTYRGSQRRSNY